MEIKTFNKDNFPFEYLDDLVDNQIKCWWEEPFWEFAKCSNSNCNKMFSIEDIYGDIKNYQDNFNELNNCCDECNSKTNLLYSKEYFRDIIIDYVKWNVELILLLENDKIEWFWIYNKKTLSEVIDYEWNLRPNSFKKECIEKNMKHLGLNNNQEVNLFQHIYISNDYRKGTLWYKLVNKFLDIEDKTLPSFLETKFNGEFYPVWRKIWYTNVLNDKYWYVIQIKLPNKIKEKTSFYKQEANNILEINNYFPESKFYR